MNQNTKTIQGNEYKIQQGIENDSPSTKKQRNTITINIICEDEIIEQNIFLQKLKSIVSSPQAKDYLNDPPCSPIKNKEEKQIDTKNTNHLKLGVTQKVLTECNEPDQKQAQQSTTLLEIISNKKIPQKKLEQIKDKTRSLSTPFQSITQKRVSTFAATAKTNKFIITSDLPELVEKKKILNQSYKKDNSLTKTPPQERKVISNVNQLNIRQKIKSDENDLRIKKDFLIQKKANSHITLQNIMSFHSKRQLLKNIRFQPDQKLNESRQSIISDQNDILNQTGFNRQLKRDSAIINLGVEYNDNIIENVDDNGNLKEGEIIANEEEINNNLKKQIGKSYYMQRKLFLAKQKRVSSQLQNQFQSSQQDNNLRMSDFFFHGNIHANSKALQVKLQIDPNQDLQNGHGINIFRDDNSKNVSSPQKSFRLCFENKPKEQDDSQITEKGRIGSIKNKDNQNDNKIQNQNMFMPLHNNIKSSNPLELSNVFSAGLKQSVILNKYNSQIQNNHNSSNNNNNPQILRKKSQSVANDSNYMHKASNSQQSQGGNTQSIILSNSRGGKSPNSNRHSGSRFSGFESGSMLFTEGDQEELERQKKRREKSPLNYLFQKYPEVIKENYSFMKMKMKQIVDIYDVVQPTAEEQLIEDFQKYSDNLNNKMKNKLMRESSKINSSKKMPLLKLKEGLNIQQKKLYSQINQMTHELELNKRQMKFLQTNQRNFNKTLVDLDNVLIPSSEFNVSDFIYKNYMCKQKEQKDMGSSLTSKRLVTQ